MTIRDHLKRRTKKFAAIALLGWLICAMTPLFLRGHPNCRPDCRAAPHFDRFPLTFALGFPLFFGGALGLALFVKCPRCKGRLAQLAITLVTPAAMTRRMNFCPYCGVNVDEPMSAGAK